MKIYTNIIDTIDPELRAMIQAYYSRSTMSIKDRVAVLGDTEEKMRNSLKQTYIGYGHDSVGEMGTLTVFFEGVSMLAAKAIQDHPLYIGQESSTRYIDFSSQPFVNPTGSSTMALVQETLRAFYTKSLPLVIEEIKKKYPRQEGDDVKVYEKTVKAKAFDIMRGYLPAGAATNVAWTSNFTVMGRHLRKMMGHPLQEVQQIAKETYSQLLENYPNSFKKVFDINQDEAFYFDVMPFDEMKMGFIKTEKPLDVTSLSPHQYKMVDVECVNYLLDFGSYRDLQRHRNVKWLSPILDTDKGFNEFYIDNLPKSLQDEALQLVYTIKAISRELDLTDVENQYMIPMGFNVTINMKFDLDQAIYMAKLRSSKPVHPTLRVWAQDLGRYLKAEYNLDVEGVDYDTDNWTLKRGTQDIVIKNEI